MYYLVNIASTLLILASAFVLYRQGLAQKMRDGATLFFHRHGRLCRGAVLVASGLFVALAVLATPLSAGGDTSGYLRGAVGLARGQGFDSVPSSRGPGMAILLGSIFYAFGANSAGAVQTLLAAMAGASAWMVYPVSRRLGLPLGLSLAGVALTAGSLSYIARASIIMTEVPTAFFCMMALYALLSFIKDRRPGSLLALGAALLWVILIRPENTALALFCLALVFVRIWSGGGRGGLRHSTIALASTLLMVVLPLLFLAQQRERQFGAFDISNSSGIVFFSGIIIYGVTHGHDFTGRGNLPLDTIIETLSHIEGMPSDPKELLTLGTKELTYGYQAASRLGYNETDALFGQAAFEAVRLQPWDMASMLLHKVYIYIFHDVTVRYAPGVAPKRPSFPGDEAGYLAAPAPPLVAAIPVMKVLLAVFQKAAAYAGLFWNHIALLGLLGSAWKARRSLPHLALVGFVALKVLVPIMFGLGDQRFYLPGYPFLVIALLWGFVMLDHFGERLVARPSTHA
ncbi:MAG: hypothetical protein HZC25_16145 [Rhodospirillales bacterium]|nr:hypothetical protein [Rhodospirillales bacterium]